MVAGMLIEANRFYEHDEHGRIVVLGLHRIYNRFDTESGHGEDVQVVVRFATAWDHYGPMPGGGTGEPLDEFVSQASGPLQDTLPEFVEEDEWESG